MPALKVVARRPRGRMTAYAFFVQTYRKEQEKNHPEENIVFLEFAKMCAERWKIMPEMEKKRFDKMAEDDKKRYDEELKIYNLITKEEKQQGKKRKQDHDPKSPKRPLTAFSWFSKDERPKVMNENPGLGSGDIARELGSRWANAKSADRSTYQTKAEQDMARYEEEITAYKKKKNPAMVSAPQQQPIPVSKPDDLNDEEASSSVD